MYGTLYFDIETADADELFTYGNSEFTRLFGAARNGSSVAITTEAEKLIQALNAADEIVGHNILGFDLLALAYHNGADWESLTAKSRDTLLLARLADPPRAKSTKGVERDKYDLDHISTKFGCEGKLMDLRELKREFKGYDQIPTDDPRFIDYLTRDVEATRDIADHYPMTAYGAREHKLATLAGRMTLNGFRVDVPLLNERINEGEWRRLSTLEILHSKYGLPRYRSITRGRGKKKHIELMELDSPLATLEGDAWLEKIYVDFKVWNPPRTANGSLSMASGILNQMIKDPKIPPELKEILRLIVTVNTVRTVYQTVADNLVGDRVHAKVSMAQASGRWSVTSPGLTVFGKRGQRFHERDVFLPEEGHSLISCDMSQLDMRAVAGHCQDANYMALFAPGRDAHEEVALRVFGTKTRRQDAKVIGHGYNYGLGAKHMIRDGLDPDLVNAFIDGMESQFPGLMDWQKRARHIGASGELLDNGFGRKMRCDPNRAYTQAPALMGQGTARDIVGDALLNLPREYDPFLRVFVHDEIVMSVPTEDALEIAHDVKDKMTGEWRGVPITCDLSKPGQNWGEVSEK